MSKRQTQKILERAYYDYADNVYNYAYYTTYSREDAEDITQQVYVKYAEALGKGTDIENPQAYLIRATRNLAINLQKSQGKEADVPEGFIEDAADEKLYSDPERATLLADQRVQVASATMQLTEEQRTALILKEIEGLSYEEIAEIIGSNPNAVGALLTRGRLQFREAFRMKQIDLEKLEKECQTYMPLLSSYMDGKLSENEKTMLEAHLEKCPLCRLAVDEMKESTQSYRALVPLIPPAALMGSITAKAAIGGTATVGATASTAGAGTLFIPRFVAKVASLSLGAKIAAGALAGLLVAGTVTGGVLLSGNDNQDAKHNTASTESNAIPVISTVTPDKAAPNSVITITGSSLGTSPGSVSIKVIYPSSHNRVDDLPDSSIRSWSDTKIEFMLPSTCQSGETVCVTVRSTNDIQSELSSSTIVVSGTPSSTAPSSGSTSSSTSSNSTTTAAAYIPPADTLKVPSPAPSGYDWQEAWNLGQVKQTKKFNFRIKGNSYPHSKFHVEAVGSNVQTGNSIKVYRAGETTPMMNLALPDTSSMNSSSSKIANKDCPLGLPAGNYTLEVIVNSGGCYYYITLDEWGTYSEFDGWNATW